MPLISSMVMVLLNSAGEIFSSEMMSSPSRMPDFMQVMILFSIGVSPRGRATCLAVFGAMMFRTSFAEVQGWAPTFKRLLVPSERGEVMGPGTANSSLPWS